MVANVHNVGGRLMLELDQSIIDRLRLRDGDRFEVTPSGEGFLALPISDAERRARFEAALQDTNERYGGMLKRLAE